MSVQLHILRPGGDDDGPKLHGQPVIHEKNSIVSKRTASFSVFRVPVTSHETVRVRDVLYRRHACRPHQALAATNSAGEAECNSISLRLGFAQLDTLKGLV
jgi:hypothetical protein